MVGFGGRVGELWKIIGFKMEVPVVRGWEEISQVK